MQFPSNPVAGQVVTSVAQSFIYQNGGWVSQPVLTGITQDSTSQSILTAVSHIRGSAGIDYSTNKPALPVLGANLTGLYAGYLLVATVPPLASRSEVEINNTSGGSIVVVLDDGAAATGAALSNASLFTLNGDTVGFTGGSWSSSYFKGRLQVFSSDTNAQIFINVR